MTDTTLAAAPVSQTISPAREVWLSLKANKGAMAGLVVIAILIVAALLADVIAPYHYAEVFKECVTKQCPPVWQEGSDPRFILGADAVGRDLLSRIIYGSRYSLFIGTIVVTISLAAGILFGLLSGFFRGTIDILIMRAMDIILSVPSLLLALAIVAILGSGLLNAMIAVAITYVPHYARLARRGRRHLAPDAEHGAAELPGAADRAGNLELLDRHPGRRRPRLPRLRCAGADAGMGHHAGRRAHADPLHALGGDLPGPRDPDHRAGV